MILVEDDEKKVQEIELFGMKIAIEFPAGSTKHGKNSKTGERWSRHYKDHYGYIVDSMGIDGDSLDCFVRKDPLPSADVYIVTQLKFDGSGIDEEKCMLGYSSKQEAKQAYIDHCPNPKDMFGGIQRMSQNKFAHSAAESDGKNPIVAVSADGELVERRFSSWKDAYCWKDSLPRSVAALYEIRGHIGKRMIVEQISAGDLRDMMIPVLSCDEYVPKESDENIVFGFFVREVPESIEPLRRVVEQCPGVLLADSADSDTLSRTSIVYAEFKRETLDIDQVDHMVSLIAMIGDLKPDDFSVKFPGVNELFEYDPKTLKEYLDAAARDAEDEETEESLEESD